MNLFELVFKQMRQRALGTWLTMLSVLLGVALTTAVLIVYRESDRIFVQTDFGYDIIVGAKGSPLQLVLNTVYGIDRSPSSIPYRIYEELASPRNREVKLAIPVALGDTYEKHAIIGTIPRMFGADDEGKPLVGEDPKRIFQYRQGTPFKLAAGRVFHARKFEAVIGADVVQGAKLDIGSKFKATHGGVEGDVHDEQWEVVGRLAPTGTAADRNIYIPLISFYAIGGHEEALLKQAELRGEDKPLAGEQSEHAHAHDHGAGKTEEEDDDDPLAPDEEPEAHAHHGHGHDHAHAYHLDDGLIHLEIPKSQWAVNAVYVLTRGGGYTAMTLLYNINNKGEATAASPAMEMRSFFDTFFKPSTMVLSILSVLVMVVAAVGILVSIYNSVAARRHEIAVLRALGATRGKIVTLICLEAAAVGLLGAVAGMVVGHLLAAVGSGYAERAVGQPFNWVAVSGMEWILLAGVVVLSLLAGLVPAIAAYRTPVAENLARA